MKRCTTSERTALVWPQGMLILDTTTDVLYIGDGVTYGGKAVGGSGECQVPAHLSTYDHTLLHSNTLDHSSANDPSSGEKSALAGTAGTPGSGNKFVTNDDTRNTNARDPTSHTHNYEPANSNIQAHVTGTGSPHTAAGVGAEPANSNIQTHVTGTGSPHTAAGVGAEASGAVSTHNTLTGPHASATSVGGKSIPAAGIEPAGTGHTEASDHVAAHASITVSVHGFDSSGNAPPQNHDAAKVTTGTFDGDRLPALSSTKKGACPATGTPANKYLRDDGTWQTVSAAPAETEGLNKAPTGSITLAAGYAGYIPESYEIAVNQYLELGSDSTFEIG